jgi:hypothetical protein
MQREIGSPRTKGKKAMQPQTLPCLFQVSDTTPRAVLRVGYEGTGIVFYLVRCRNAAAFRDYTQTFRLEAPMSTKAVPAGKTYRRCGEAWGAILPEVLNGVLIEIHCVVLAQAEADRREELRCWRHEIGHAADLAKPAVETLLAFVHTNPKGCVRMHERVLEIPALITELLCDAVDIGFAPRTADTTFLAPQSGFPMLFKPGALA